jgi:peptidase inhibitor family I36/beta/gamma crystallin
MKALQRFTFLIVTFLLFALTAAIAQTDVPRNGACFYRDTGYRGSYFCAQAGDSLESLPRGFNDAIRSVRIFGNSQVTVFSDSKFAGANTTLRSDVPDLHMLQMGNDRSRNWTERISSVQVGRGGGGYFGDRDRDHDRDRDNRPTWNTGQNYRGTGACFFDQANFRGHSFCVDRGQALNNLPSGFNDRIQSIRVMGGAEVQMFNDNNFGGVAARTRRDVPDLHAWRIPDDPSRNWGGRISSVRVDSPRDGRWNNNGGYGGYDRDHDRDRDRDHDRDDHRDHDR